MFERHDFVESDSDMMSNNNLNKKKFVDEPQGEICWEKIWNMLPKLRL
jgi:hypothetical protein